MVISAPPSCSATEDASYRPCGEAIMAPRKALSFRLFLKHSLAFSPASNLASAFFLGSSDTSLVSALSVQPFAIFEYILPTPYIKKLSCRKGDPHPYRYATKHHSFKAASLTIVSTISASCALKRVVVLCQQQLSLKVGK